MSDLNIQLLPWQQEVWSDPARFKVIAAGRRCGKSRYACNKMIVEALATDRGHVFYIAPTQGQARDIMWGMLCELAAPVIKQAHINNMQVTLINGSTISLKGADRPETMKGVSLKFVVLDEFAEMKPMVWEEVIRPALADLKGGAVFIGTPLGRNHFWDLYQYAELENDPDWRAWHLTSFDNPLLDPKEIEAAKKTMGSFAFRQEFMAAFEAKESALFQEDWLRFDTQEPDTGEYFIAVDLAGFEEVDGKTKESRLDQTAICIAKVNEDGWWIKEIIHGRWSLKETANKIFKAVHDNKPVAVGIEKGIAQQAVMSPLADLQRRYGRYFRIDLLTHGNKRKVDRIMWALQGRMEHGRITLNKGDWNVTFMDQLFQFPSKLTHDDLLDATAYIDQLTEIAYAGAFAIEDTFDPLDDVSGY